MKTTFAMIMLIVMIQISTSTAGFFNGDSNKEILNLPSTAQNEPKSATSDSSTIQEKHHVPTRITNSNGELVKILLLGREHPVTFERETLYNLFIGDETKEILFPENKVVTSDPLFLQ